MFDLCLKKLREEKNVRGSVDFNFQSQEETGHTRQANSMGLKYPEQHVLLYTACFETASCEISIRPWLNCTFSTAGDKKSFEFALHFS